MRKIIHIDMDAFYASVEQRDFPEFRQKPLAVGGSRERGVVMTASYEARKYGVRSAMPSNQAFRLCPQILFTPPRFPVYKEVSQQIREIFHSYTDLVEPLSLDEAYLDVTSNKKGIDSATTIARHIKQEIQQQTQLTASAGVSVNKFLAKVASDYQKPDGLSVILPEQVGGFMDELEIEKFHGIGKVTAQKMKQMGIHKGGDLKQFTIERMVELFGKPGKFYFEIAHGVDNREVNPNRLRKSVSVEDTFEKDLTDLESMHFEVKRIGRKVMQWMESQEIYGRTVTLKVKYHDFNQVTRSRTSHEFVDNAESLEAITSNLLDNLGYVKPVRLLGVGVSNLNNQPNQNLQLTLGL